MNVKVGTKGQAARSDNEARRRLDELEWVLESDYLSYLHPRVVASMKQLIARQRSLDTFP
jgi:hypothetical protein